MSAAAPLLWIGALVTGLLIPLQLAFNAQLARGIGNPLSAALIVAIAMCMALGVLTLATRATLPSASTIMAIPFTAWIGGLLAAFYIVSIVILTPRLGVGATTGFILVGQIIAAMLLDHFGLFQNPQHLLNGWRLAGAFLMTSGIILIKSH